MPYTERPLDVEELEEIATFCDNGLQTVEIASVETSAEDVVGAIDAHTDAIQQAVLVGSLTLDREDCTYISLFLGCLFGDQLNQALGWDWCCLVDGENEFYAVAAQDRSLVVFPSDFITSCLEDPKIDCTVMLAFNMLSAGRFGGEPANGYLDVLSQVTRVVPRR